MTTPTTELTGALESIVGSDHVTEEPRIKIDGLQPNVLARPASAAEVARCLKACSELDAAVVPAGLMTWLDCGDPLRGADVVLCLDRMSRVVHYSAPDLTATVEAGLTLGEFNSIANNQRQWLPLDPPGFQTASLGAVAACNSSGALRLGFGTPRDYVIGLKLAHADGAESKSGGQVVKNVAGYDMNKLYVGSYGTLAIITELTFKLRPLAEHNATILVASKDRGALFQLAARVLSSELQPSSIVLTRRLSPVPESGSTDDVLLIRFIDSAAAVEHQVAWVMSSLESSCEGFLLGKDESVSAWSEVALLGRRPIKVRMSVPLSATMALFEKALRVHLDCVSSVDIGTGIIRLAFDGANSAVIENIKRLRDSAATVNGTVVIEEGPAEVRREAGAWGDPGSMANLMRSVKTGFDPRSLLNPGKFVLGL